MSDATSSNYCIGPYLTRLELSALATNCLYTSSKPHIGIIKFKNVLHNYMMLQENRLFHAAAIQSTESSQWTTKPRLLEATRPLHDQ